MSNNGLTKRLSTVDRAMSLLSLFLKYDTLSLMDIEQELMISKTAAFRMTATMSDRGFLIKDLDSKKYSPGPILFQLVRKYQTSHIVSISQPFLQKMSQEIGETIYISIRSGHKYIYINGIESQKALKVTSPIGDEVDFYYSAAGKLHMSYMSTTEVNNYFKHTVLKPFTSQTKTDENQLMKELAQIREHGYSTSLGERESGTGGVAAPIWGYEEEPTAVLSVILPLSRMQKQQLVEYVTYYAKKITDHFNSR